MNREDLNKLNAAMQGLDRWREVPSVEAAFQLLKEVQESLKVDVEQFEQWLKDLEKPIDVKPITSGPPTPAPTPFIDFDKIFRYDWNNLPDTNQPVKLKGCPNKGGQCFCPGTCMEPVDVAHSNTTFSEIFAKQMQEEVEAHKAEFERIRSEENFNPLDSLTKEDVKIILSGAPEPIVKLWKVNIVEAERGWGRKVEDVRWFATKQEAEDFIKDYNKGLPDAAPDYYWQAEGPYYAG